MTEIGNTYTFSPMIDVIGSPQGMNNEAALACGSTESEAEGVEEPTKYSSPSLHPLLGTDAAFIFLFFHRPALM